MPEDKYTAQKKYLAKRKKIGISVDAEKYELFKQTAKSNGTSIYALINNFIDEYLQSSGE